MITSVLRLRLKTEQKENGEFFLSSIAPDEWDKDYQGSFELNVERFFEKVDFPKDNGGFKINLPQ